MRERKFLTLIHGCMRIVSSSAVVILDLVDGAEGRRATNAGVRHGGSFQA